MIYKKKTQQSADSIIGVHPGRCTLCPICLTDEP